MCVCSHGCADFAFLLRLLSYTSLQGSADLGMKLKEREVCSGVNAAVYQEHLILTPILLSTSATFVFSRFRSFLSALSQAVTLAT